MYLNKAIIIGNLTRDPELKALPSGTKVCNLGIATNRFFKDKDGNKQEAVEFHNVTAFGKLGELAGQYLKKGQQVLVEGRMQTRSWDASDGSKRYRTEIIADNVQFGSKAGSGGGSAGGKGSDASGGGSEVPAGAPADSGEKIDYPQEEINPDEIPF